MAESGSTDSAPRPCARTFTAEGRTVTQGKRGQAGCGKLLVLERKCRRLEPYGEERR